MPIIQANTGIVTQINVFTVPAGGQQALVDLLADSAKFASSIPGWISASIHRSCDGTRVVNYAQSESPEAAQRIISRIAAISMTSLTRRRDSTHPLTPCSVAVRRTESRNHTPCTRP